VEDHFNGADASPFELDQVRYVSIAVDKYVALVQVSQHHDEGALAETAVGEPWQEARIVVSVAS